MRHAEDQVKVANRQQFPSPGTQPLLPGIGLALRTMPVAAGVVGAADETALGTGLSVTAEGCRPAQLDGAHHAALDAAETLLVRAPIGVAVAAEHVRHFQACRQRGRRSGGWNDLQPQPVERALRPPD